MIASEEQKEIINKWCDYMYEALEKFKKELSESDDLEDTKDNLPDAPASEVYVTPYIRLKRWLMEKPRDREKVADLPHGSIWTNKEGDLELLAICYGKDSIPFTGDGYYVFGWLRRVSHSNEPAEFVLESCGDRLMEYMLNLSSTEREEAIKMIDSINKALNNFSK